MQKIACSFGWYLKSLLLVVFLLFIATCGMYAAAAAELLYPAHNLDFAPKVLESFVRRDGNGICEQTFIDYELYRAIGVDCMDPQDVVLDRCRQLIRQYIAEEETNASASYRVRFLKNAFAILSKYRREYNILFYFWMHSESNRHPVVLRTFAEICEIPGL